MCNLKNSKLSDKIVQLLQFVIITILDFENVVQTVNFTVWLSK